MEWVFIAFWLYATLTIMRRHWRFMLPGLVGAVVFMFFARYLVHAGLDFHHYKLLVTVIAAFYWGTRGQAFFTRSFPEQNRRENHVQRTRHTRRFDRTE